MGAPKRIVAGVAVLCAVSASWFAETWAGTLTVAGGNGDGSASDELSLPRRVALDAAGNLYVADSGNGRVQKWAPGATKGVTVAAGDGVGVTDVELDAAGNLYTLDSYNARVQRWAPGATEGTTVAGGNGTGAAANQLSSPLGIALDGVGRLFVADSGNGRVQQWAPGATEGVTVAGGNGPGSAANQFQMPVDVALDAAGNLYVVDKFNSRVQRWAPGSTEGVTVAQGLQMSPESLTVDAEGNVYVAGPDRYDRHACTDVSVGGRVERWAPGATAGVTVAGGNGGGSAPNQLEHPGGVDVDAAGRIFVADTCNHRVQQVVLDLPQIAARDVVSVITDTGLGGAAVTNPVTVTGTPTPVVTYNGGDWPASFPLGTTTVTVEASNIVGSTTATFTVTIVDRLPATGVGPMMVMLTAAALVVAGLGMRRGARRART